MSRSLAVAWAMGRLVLHDTLGLVFVFVVPAVIAVVLGGIYGASDVQTSHVGLLREGNGAVSQRLETHLRARPLLDVAVFTDRAELDRAVLRQDANAAIVVPADVDTSGRVDPTAVQLIGTPGVNAPRGMRAEVETAVAQTAAEVTIARALAPEDPLGRGLGLAEQESAAIEQATPDVSTGARTNYHNAVGLFAALVLFSFMNTAAGAGGMAHLRELGILARMRTSAATSRETVVGYGIYLAIAGITQSLVIAVVGTVAMGISWPNPLALLGVIVVVGIASGSLGALFGSLLPNRLSSVTIAAPVTFVLAMLGGCLWTLDLLGPTMQRLGHFTPHAWAIDALKGVLDGGNPSGTAGAVLVLLAMSAGFAALAVVLLQRKSWTA